MFHAVVGYNIGKLTKLHVHVENHTVCNRTAAVITYLIVNIILLYTMV